MKNAAQKLIDKLPQLEAALSSLTKNNVLVGVPREKTIRKTESEGMNNATLAYIHDKGSPANNIPARPFMEPGIESAKDRLIVIFKNTAKDAISGGADAIDKGLHRAGLVAQASIRNKINEGIAPPLKPATLAARKRIGAKGEKPLVRTGQMRNSINYVIRKK